MFGERNKVLNKNILKVPAGYPNPQVVFERHFPEVKDRLIVKGGWGYTKDDACIIVMNNGKGSSDDILGLSDFMGDTLDGISLENLFIHYRLREEFEYAHSDKYYGMEWTKKRQALVTDFSRKPYDRISVDASAFKEEDWNFLKNDLEKHGNYENDADGKARHYMMREERIIRFSEEFWFDISSFH